MATLPAETGGSVSFEGDAASFLRKDEALLAFIHKTLDIEQVGWAPNGGRSFIHPEGVRTLPYGFMAKPKGRPGTSYTVLVMIEANDAGNGVTLRILPRNAPGTPEGMTGSPK